MGSLSVVEFESDFELVLLITLFGLTTVTTQEAILPPTFAVIVAVPTLTAVTVPPDTPTTLSFEVDHITAFESDVSNG